MLRALQLGQQQHTYFPETFLAKTVVLIVTNFTDGILQKFVKGTFVKNGIYIDLHTVGYKQYAFFLKNPDAQSAIPKPDFVFFFFQTNPYLANEFIEQPASFLGVLDDVARFAQTTSAKIFFHTFINSSRNSYGHLHDQHESCARIRNWNDKIRECADKRSNIVVFDTDRFVRRFSETEMYDVRSLYAFDQPYTHDFLHALAKEWYELVTICLGFARKCLVLDLDNTLWGGVVGEVGVNGLALGVDYPGNAYHSFQKLILELYERGVILALNSKNNFDDAIEVIRNHPYMVLREQHFSAMQINWDDKATNIERIAKELNIGLNSMVFLDDDPVNRELVRSRLPEVLVPEFSMPPEEYVPFLLNRNPFQQLQLTEEDRLRGQMYAQERMRKTVFEQSKDLDEYLRSLNISLKIDVNSAEALPRLAQLTMKTNQFNLTTKRYTISDIEKIISDGGLVYSGDASDRFGRYGVTNLAILTLSSSEEVEIDVFLMSCRVMGRRIEEAFLRSVCADVYRRGIRKVRGLFIPTQKNLPAKDFLSGHGFTKEEEGADGSVRYVMGFDSDPVLDPINQVVSVTFDVK